VNLVEVYDEYRNHQQNAYNKNLTSFFVKVKWETVFTLQYREKGARHKHTIVND